MKEVKNIEKSMTIGDGKYSYKGVADKDVKEIIGASMAKNGLCILPIGIESKTDVSRWEEVDEWSKSVPKATKQKQSVFTEVTTKYLLLHESGEGIEICGLGHGVDSQDKSAGKATTYALKYALLYAFLIPTVKIDDADNTAPEPSAPKVSVKKLVPLTEAKFDDAVKFIKSGKTIDDLKVFYELTTDMEVKLISATNDRKV